MVRVTLKVLFMAGAVALVCAPAMALRYSTGAVKDYTSNGGGGPDLPNTLPEAADFRGWLSGAGDSITTQWANGDVWGSDFRDAGSPNDRDGSGGSDITQLYYFTGHGSCQVAPVATDPDFIVTHGNFGTPDFDNIGTTGRWGSASGGTLQFLLLDASCPMDLVSIENNWFPPFAGMHVATGNSGNTTHDTLDSESRGNDFGASLVDHTVWLFFTSHAESVGDAWMDNGTEDVQSQVCAVAIAAGNDRNDAIDRRENEKLNDNRSDPTPNWFAWKWTCAS